MAVHIELRRGFRRLDLPPAKGHELRAEVLDRFQPARQKPLSAGSLGHVPGGSAVRGHHRKNRKRDRSTTSGMGVVEETSRSHSQVVPRGWITRSNHAPWKHTKKEKTICL